jgi:3',5'-cyclic-AMP phosphodiesterase
MQTSKRLAWLSDIHLNFIKDEMVRGFCSTVLDNDPDAILISGDISESGTIQKHLEMLAAAWKLPIYFVLGNHDYYRGSITGVRRAMVELSEKSEWLSWLPASGIIELTSDTCLIGHDLWADGRFGDFANSGIMLNDYRLIEELTGLSVKDRLLALNQLGDEAAQYLNGLFLDAEEYKHIIVLTHVPPFKEACWHHGKIADDEWLPHFSCRAAGQVFRKYMERFPEKKMTILCGHCHSSGSAEILPNLHVKTGGAVYKSPEVQEILTVT